jgi:MYXO-CTERM domain-containing protein
MWLMPLLVAGFELPCASCLRDDPKTTGRPLVVVLHGDGQPAQAARAPFHALAVERDIGLFVPTCPRSEGCSAGSYWRWNGDPSWLRLRVAEYARAIGSDPSRIAVVGWSGGASYLGYRLPELGAEYNVVAFLGGGMAPAITGCEPSAARPAYFLVGDKNPYHGLAKELRAAADRCGYAVSWNLLPGADHAGEWRAVSSRDRMGALLDFIVANPRTLAAAAPGFGGDAGTYADDGGARPNPGPSAASPSASGTARTGSGEVPPGRTHGCTVASSRGGAMGIAVLLLALVLRRRRTRAHVDPSTLTR